MIIALEGGRNFKDLLYQILHFYTIKWSTGEVNGFDQYHYASL